ncbi:unnamed protein product, partial [Rotaria socialis]
MEYRTDSYSGFNDYNPLLDTDDLKHDTNLQQAVLKTSHGRRAPTSTQKTGMFSKLKNVFTRPKNTAVPVPSARLGTASRAVRQENSVAGARPGSTLHRPVTAQNRPSTAIRSAGFIAGSGAFGSYTSVPEPIQYEMKDESNEEKARKIERTIFNLAEESCFAYEENNIKLALEKAEEAMKLDKTHARYRDEHNMSESNVNLSGFVILNCANMSAKCGMKVEAMNLYNLILKNKLLPVHSRVRINIGNVFVSSKQYANALKMYRMALDQISEQNVNLKMNVRQNIAATHILMGQYAEAAQMYEIVMQERPNHRCGLNLLLCYYAIGQLDKARRAFTDLLKIPFQTSEDNYPVSLGKEDKQVSLVTEAIRDDRYKQMERKRRHFAEHVIVTAVKIIGNISEQDSINGYEWCIEQVRNSTYLELASGLEIQKAIAYLREDNFPKAIAILKEFEKAEAKLASAAATNLSFLHFLKKDLNNAHKYADLALKSDKFNPASLTNKGNCCFVQHDYEKARYYYEEALNIDAGCVQALHNLILTLIQSKQYQRVKDFLHKYATIQPDNSQVACLMAKVLQETHDFDQAKS